jgi:hypothetical protein
MTAILCLKHVACCKQDIVVERIVYIVFNSSSASKQIFFKKDQFIDLNLFGRI